MSRVSSTGKVEAALRQAVVVSGWAVAASSPAFGCGPTAVQSALAAPGVAGKFSLASGFCSQAVESLRSASPAPVAAHAEQLWLYDRTSPAALPRVAPETEGLSAAPAVPVPAALMPAHRGTALPTPKSLGRHAASRALALVPQISHAADAHGIDPLLLHAIAHVESRHNPDAVSHAGAVGLMQVMPATARRFGLTLPHAQLRNPTISLDVSSRYLKVLQRRFDNNLTLVIAAYNAGEGAVEKYGRKVPPYKETQGYVRDVLAHYRLLLGARDAHRATARVAL